MKIYLDPGARVTMVALLFVGMGQAQLTLDLFKRLHQENGLLDYPSFRNIPYNYIGNLVYPLTASYSSKDQDSGNTISLKKLGLVKTSGDEDYYDDELDEVEVPKEINPENLIAILAVAAEMIKLRVARKMKVKKFKPAKTEFSLGLPSIQPTLALLDYNPLAPNPFANLQPPGAGPTASLLNAPETGFLPNPLFSPDLINYYLNRYYPNNGLPLGTKSQTPPAKTSLVTQLLPTSISQMLPASLSQMLPTSLSQMLPTSISQMLPTSISQILGSNEKPHNEVIEALKRSPWNPFSDTYKNTGQSWTSNIIKATKKMADTAYTSAKPQLSSVIAYLNSFME